MHPSLSEVQTIARQAGEILRAGYGREHDIDHKGVTDLVTEVDRQSEALILKEIRARFPDHSIITEESGSLDGDHDHCWYIDPLDGTVNYAHAVPIFSVSLAYAYRGQLQIGVVYDPMRDECFSAERGGGAWLNETPLHVSPIAELVDSLLVTGFPYDTWKNSHTNMEYFETFARRTQGVRRLGSAALDLSYVAAGRLDGFWEISIYPWDIAAGGLITQEAGGIVTGRSGDPDYLKPPCTILAANPALYPLMLEVLKIP